jgi:hypothetical protein
MVSDIVLASPLPPKVVSAPQAYVGCISGAILKKDYLAHIKAAGFKDVEVVAEDSFPIENLEDDATAKASGSGIRLTRKEIEAAAKSIRSVKVKAVRR